MIGVYKLDEDFCYGSIEGIFIADSEEIDFAVETGVTVWLGEVLGKYSEIEIKVDKDTFQLISSNPDEIDILAKAQIGYNLFDEENYSFDSDELNDVVNVLNEKHKYYNLSTFIKYIKDEGIYDTIKEGRYSPEQMRRLS